MVLLDAPGTVCSGSSAVARADAPCRPQTTVGGERIVGFFRKDEGFLALSGRFPPPHRLRGHPAQHLLAGARSAYSLACQGGTPTAHRVSETIRGSGLGARLTLSGYVKSVTF